MSLMNKRMGGRLARYCYGCREYIPLQEWTDGVDKVRYYHSHECYANKTRGGRRVKE